MSTQPKTFLTPEQYLEIERKAQSKSEYYGGEMFAMAGARFAHKILVARLIHELSRHLLPRGCHVLPGDMRLRVTATGLYTYPDVVVVHGEPQFLDGEFDTLLNPTVIVEVLSPSTENYDRVGKFENYQSLPSLREYLIVSSDRMRTELFTRSADNEWHLTVSSGETDRIELKSVDCQIPLAELYRQVKFPPESGQRPLIHS